MSFACTFVVLQIRLFPKDGHVPQDFFWDRRKGNSKMAYCYLLGFLNFRAYVLLKSAIIVLFAILENKKVYISEDSESG